LIYFQKALALQQALGYEHGIALSWFNLAHLQQQTSRLTASIDYAGKALQIFQETGNRQDMSKVCRLLARVWEQKGDYRQALRYQQQGEALQDSIFNPEKSRLVSRLETGHILERQQIELEGIAKDRQLETERHTAYQARLTGWLVGMGLLSALLALAFYHVGHLYRLQKRHAAEADQ
jgi:tetratricopeptide (TPR) repeat protein